ncbi:MAG: NAD(P)/FAD-dependent oxidoreductase [Elusimicrobiales bacterium]|nr:NAD(P)/FAD-dependent oxidoreductase [Elusimicrobiales bacterium]
MKEQPPGNSVIVIGGGPAGLMAAGRAAELGARATVLEKNQRLGLKLLTTGGGRCNVTNSAGLKGFIAAFGPNGKFLYRALTVFSNAGLTGFLKSFGVPVRTDPDGKVFPADDKAQSVLDALHCYVSRGKVTTLFGAQASALVLGPDSAVAGVKTADGRVVRGSKVIIATGGLSYPATGSTGDGYALARQCGHTITPLRPGLTALESAEPFIKDLQGLTLQGITLTLIINGKRGKPQAGDLLFTHFGVSGPLVLVMSGPASDALAEPGGKAEFSVNLKPALSREALAAEMQAYFASNGGKQFASYVKASLPASLAPVFERRCGIDRARQCASVTAAERRQAAELLGDFRIKLSRARPLREATVTRGGVALGEVNPQTLESRLVPGLYFCGEVLDLDGITGGYNLQEAFSTGYLAGQSAAEAGGAA